MASSNVNGAPAEGRWERFKSGYKKQWVQHPYRTYAIHFAIALLLSIVVISSLGAAHQGPSLGQVADLTYNSPGAGIGCLLGFMVLVGVPLAFYIRRKIWPERRLEEYAGDKDDKKVDEPAHETTKPENPSSGSSPFSDPQPLVLTFKDLGLTPLTPADIDRINRTTPTPPKPKASGPIGGAYKPVGADWGYSLVPPLGGKSKTSAFG